MRTKSGVTTKPEMTKKSSIRSSTHGLNVTARVSSDLRHRLPKGQADIAKKLFGELSATLLYHFA